MYQPLNLRHSIQIILKIRYFHSLEREFTPTQTFSLSSWFFWRLEVFPKFEFIMQGSSVTKRETYQPFTLRDYTQIILKIRQFQSWERELSWTLTLSMLPWFYKRSEVFPNFDFNMYGSLVTIGQHLSHSILENQLGLFWK